MFEGFCYSDGNLFTSKYISALTHIHIQKYTKH